MDSKDKVINDLLSRIAKLEYEVERLNNNNQDMQEEMVRTWKKYDELQQRIDRAVEYIEERGQFFDKVGDYVVPHFDKDNVKELRDILRGDKE